MERLGNPKQVKSYSDRHTEQMAVQCGCIKELEIWLRHDFLKVGIYCNHVGSFITGWEPCDVWG